MPRPVWTSAPCPHAPLMGRDVCHTSRLKDAFGWWPSRRPCHGAMTRNLAALSAVSYSTMPLRRPSRDLPPRPPFGKLHARACHRSPGPSIARADRSRCPAVRTRVDSAHSRCAHHRLSHRSHDPEGPRDIASTPVIQREPLRHLLLAHPACEEESVPEMVCTGQLVRAPVAPTAKTGPPPG
jgi:hypothetical protein